MTEPHRRLTSVLVASDLSSNSDDVVRGASRFAQAAGAELHVVSAYQESDSGFRGGSQTDMPDAVRSEVMDALPVQIRRVLDPESRQPASMCVRFGSPEKVILDRAREVEADLIVLGRHRGSDLSASFLGTTADALVTASPVGCLILRGAVNVPFQRIGIAVDPERAPSGAFQRSVELLASVLGGANGGDARPARVTLVHAAPRGSPADSGDESQLEPLLADARRLTADGESPRIDALVVTGGDPADAITNWAWNEGVDLLVVGTRDRPRVQGSHLGSVSSAVARRARCAVLMVPPDS